MFCICTEHRPSAKNKIIGDFEQIDFFFVIEFLYFVMNSTKKQCDVHRADVAHSRAHSHATHKQGSRSFNTFLFCKCFEHNRCQNDDQKNIYI